MSGNMVLSRIPVPSLALLRASSQPQSPICTVCQTRSTSSWMPRHKYAKVNRLDKLHRAQKAALRQQKEDAEVRAVALEQSLKATVEQMSTSNIPFHIARTKTNGLPVYETTKGGGTKQITKIQKCSGDLTALQRELRNVLQLPEIVVNSKGKKRIPVAVNHLTQHVIVSGWRAAEVKKWAQFSGF